MKNGNRRNHFDNNTTTAHATRVPPRGRDRSWRRRSCYGPRAPARGSQRGGLRASGPGGRHLGLHPKGRVRPARAQPHPDHGPLEPLPLSPHEPPPRVHGFPGLPVRLTGRPGPRS